MIGGVVYDKAFAVSGVCGMGVGLSAAAVAKSLHRDDKRMRGVRVKYDEERGYTVDVYIIAAFGANIPETAWNVQKSVSEGLRDDFGIEPEDINIHVQGVHAGA